MRLRNELYKAIKATVRGMEQEWPGSHCAECARRKLDSINPDSRLESLVQVGKDLELMADRHHDTYEREHVVAGIMGSWVEDLEGSLRSDVMVFVDDNQVITMDVETGDTLSMDTELPEYTAWLGRLEGRVLE